MSVREGNENPLPYRSPVTPATNAVPYTQNEQDYSTLLAVRDIFESAVQGLYKEFNAFDVLKDGTTPEIIDQMMRKIAGNQIAYDILSPLLEAVKGAIEGADNNHKQRNS